MGPAVSAMLPKAEEHSEHWRFPRRAMRLRIGAWKAQSARACRYSFAHPAKRAATVPAIAWAVLYFAYPVVGC